MNAEKRSLPDRKWVFVLDMAAGGDLLLRALAPFPVQGAEVIRLDLQTDGDCARLEIETQGLAAKPMTIADLHACRRRAHAGV